VNPFTKPARSAELLPPIPKTCLACNACVHLCLRLLPLQLRLPLQKPGRRQMPQSPRRPQTYVFSSCSPGRPAAKSQEHTGTPVIVFCAVDTRGMLMHLNMGLPFRECPPHETNDRCPCVLWCKHPEPRSPRKLLDVSGHRLDRLFRHFRPQTFPLLFRNLTSCTDRPANRHHTPHRHSSPHGTTTSHEPPHHATSHYINTNTNTNTHTHTHTHLCFCLPRAKSTMSMPTCMKQPPSKPFGGTAGVHPAFRLPTTPTHLCTKQPTPRNPRGTPSREGADGFAPSSCPPEARTTRHRTTSGVVFVTGEPAVHDDTFSTLLGCSASSCSTSS
jgi:hypothetical protein